MLGGKNKQPLGYTIIEVMIVLAVSGVMFTIAASFINGKQEKTSFTQGVGTMASQIQDLIEQVSDGRYSDRPVNCQFDTGSGVTFPAGSAAQGANSDCVFLGKILHVTHNRSDTIIRSMAAGRVDAAGNIITDIHSAKPREAEDLQATQNIPQNLTVWGAEFILASGGIEGPYGGATDWSTLGFGFFQSQGTAVGGLAQTGAQNVLFYRTQVLESPPNQAGDLEVSSPWPIALKSASICLTDNTQYAEIVIGDDGGSLSVNVQRDGTTPCYS